MNRYPAQRIFETTAPGASDGDPVRRARRDRGAAAVEFALLMPLLLTLVLGIVEFGRVYNVQTTVSAAAREGVRTMALKNSASAARTSAKSAASATITLSDSQIAVSPGTCPVDGTATVIVTYPLPYITNFFGSSITLTGRGVMRCNG